MREARLASRSGGAWLLALFFALCATSTARAEDATARAKACFERGSARYQRGDYEAAAREFEAGYALAPRPLFLVNLGQAYRQLGQLERARDVYRRFLASAPPTDPQRASVDRIVIDLDQKLAEKKRAPTVTPSEAVLVPPPTPVTAPLPVVSAPLASQPAAVVPVATTSAPPAPAKRSFIRRHWWIIPVSVVALTGLTVGIYFAARPQEASIDCTGATLGCVK